MCIKVSKNLSITSYNVNGLYKKLGGDRICKLEDDSLRNVMTSDIVFLSETHASSNDVLFYAGYKCFTNCRKSETNRVRGGLATFVKKEILQGVKVIDKSMSDLMWIKLDKNFFGLEKNLFLCSLYIPPYNSSYTLRTNCDKQIFDKLEHDITKYSLEGNIALMGDLNAHINVKDSDFFTNEIDDSLDDFLPINYVADTVHKSRSTEISQITNSYGKQIIELCTSAQLRILNGRTLGDSKGKVTFINHNGISIDDYCIFSSEFLSSIINFTVDQFESTVSDHCPITVNLMSHFNKKQQEQLKAPIRNLKWTSEREFAFKSNLLKVNFQPVISEMESLEETLASSESLSSVEQKINGSLSNISSILYNAASIGSARNTNSFTKKTKHRKIKKPYYDSECEAKYRSLKHQSRKLCEEPWNKQLRLQVLANKKELNKLIRKKYRQFRFKMVSKLFESTSTSDDFWKTVKDLRKKNLNDPSSNVQPKEWFEYFKNLMNTEYTKNFDDICVDNKFMNYCTKNLNIRITEEEVLLALKSLKNKKSCGPDGLTNEMLKISCMMNVDMYVKLFNLILSSGIYPSRWRENFIKPIFKGGCFNNPSNYRGIALSSCLGKFFSRVLYNRLEKYLEYNKIICREQIGFKKGCRTSDHILTLKTIIDKAFKSSKMLYVCFIDFKKAFDTINRDALFLKLFKYNIKGSFLNILKDMYKEVLFAVKVSDGITDMFQSKIGVKQGCILSPTLFSLYINDLSTLFDETCEPVTLHNTQLSCLMYADDLVLISQSSVGLQNCLNKLSAYCEEWNLTVNLDKTKVMVFNKSGRKNVKDTFTYNDEIIENCTEYKYLGIIFKPSGIFSNAISLLCKKAAKALFCVKKMLYSEKNDVLSHLKLFYSCVSPIMLYCSEIWSLNIVKNTKTLESQYFSMESVKLQLKFAKGLLGVNSKAVNTAVLAELGMYPISIQALKSSIGFWLHVIDSKQPLLYDAYEANKNLPEGFASKIKNLLSKLNFSHVWENQSTLSKKRLVYAFTEKLSDNYVEFWKKSLFNDDNTTHGNKLRTYRKYKSKYELEKYLLLNLDKTITKNYAKIRISNSKLTIERGRYTKTTLEDRICPLCNIGIEDEFHFMITCSKLYDCRMKMFDEISDIIPCFSTMRNEDKVKLLFTCEEYDILKIILIGINDMYDKRNNLLADNT